MTHHRFALSLVAITLALALGAPASAIPVSVTHTDLPSCDFLAVPPGVDELGDTPAFPSDERIVAVDLFTGAVACPSSDTREPALDDPERPATPCQKARVRVRAHLDSELPPRQARIRIPRMRGVRGFVVS